MIEAEGVHLFDPKVGGLAINVVIAWLARLHKSQTNIFAALERCHEVGNGFLLDLLDERGAPGQVKTASRHKGPLRIVMKHYVGTAMVVIERVLRNLDP